MKFFKHAVLLLTVVLSSQALADAQPGQGYFSPMATFIDDDKDRAERCLEPGSDCPGRQPVGRSAAGPVRCGR